MAFMASKRWISWGFERPPTGLDARRFPHAWFALGWVAAGAQEGRSGVPVPFSSSMRDYCTKVKYQIGFAEPASSFRRRLALNFG